jgi:hypothetical protein
MEQFCAVTSFFNPANYRSRLENYSFFRDALERNGVTLYTVEGYFKGSSPTLPPLERTTSLELSCVLWHKERLLNLLIASLPRQYTKIAWLDCDVIFANPRWHESASEFLESSAVVQCFSEMLQLRPGKRHPQPGDPSLPGFVKGVADGATLGDSGIGVHGRSGYAWAARREFLDKVGLLDTCILGGADHLMAHAFSGAGWDDPCILRESGGLYSRFIDFQRWFERARPFLDAHCHHVPGLVMHLWHGTLVDRRWKSRRRILTASNFDPAQDIGVAENGSWRWTTDKPVMHEAVRQYFYQRREDGVSQSPNPSAATLIDLEELKERYSCEHQEFSELADRERIAYLESENSQLRRVVVDLNSENERLRRSLARQPLSRLGPSALRE